MYFDLTYLSLILSLKHYLGVMFFTLKLSLLLHSEMSRQIKLPNKSANLQINLQTKVYELAKSKHLNKSKVETVERNPHCLSSLDLLKWTSLVTLSASSSCFYSASVGSVNSLKMGKLFPGVTASQEEKVDHEIGWRHHQLSSLSQWLLIDGLVNITYSGSSSL